MEILARVGGKPFNQKQSSFPQVAKRAIARWVRTLRDHDTGPLTGGLSFTSLDQQTGKSNRLAGCSAEGLAQGLMTTAINVEQ